MSILGKSHSTPTTTEFCRALLAQAHMAVQVLLNVLADEIHRAHQRCMQSSTCDPLLATQDLVFEAGASTMRMLQGAYSCLCLIKSVGLVAFRDPFGIRCVESTMTLSLHFLPPRQVVEEATFMATSFRRNTYTGHACAIVAELSPVVRV